MPRTCAALLAATLLAGAAEAGPAEDCNQLRNPDLQLRGCTAYIKLGQGEPQNLAVAHLNRATIHAQRGKVRLALDDLARAFALDPSNPLVPYNRGNIHFDSGELEEAIADYSRAVALDDRFALAYFNRGLARERLGDTSAATDDYRRALTLDPQALPAQRRLEALQSQ